MNLKLETEFSTANILGEVDALKMQIDELRPLPEDVEGKVMQKLRLDWNYHSNAIEGNRLSYGETVAFLMEGITAKGKPLKDHLDIRGHNDAINFLLSIVKDSRPISEADIRNLHAMILVEPYDTKAKTAEGLSTTKRITLGEYKTSANHVKTATGEIHYYATPEETPAKMQGLMEWYKEVASNQNIHAVVIAALFHHKFVAIHPFDDGNGRLSRMLMNLILMRNGYPPIIIKMDDRQNYYSILNRADVGDSWPFVEYISERVKDSLQLYQKAAAGGDIDEDEDIDKEIALFKMQLQETSTYKEKKSYNNVSNIIVTDLHPLVTAIMNKADKFDDLFIKCSKVINLIFVYRHKHGVYRESEMFYGFNQNMLNFISSRYSNFEKIELNFFYTGFKSMRKVFNIETKRVFIFKMYNYDILDEQERLIISKKYHEGISIAERRLIVRGLIENIENQIKSNLEN